MNNPYKTKIEKIYNKKTKKDTFFVIMIHFPKRVWYNTRNIPEAVCRQTDRYQD